MPWPFKSEIFVIFAPTYKAPATKNKVILPVACVIMCKVAPCVAIEVANAPPKVI